MCIINTKMFFGWREFIQGRVRRRVYDVRTTADNGSEPHDVRTTADNGSEPHDVRTT
jgi:hypothetical protein